jgi:hypothetical protein
MRSSQENAGFVLLNKWKTKLESTGRATSINVSFSGVVTFFGVGVISFLDKKELRVTGVGFNLTLNLTEADFENVVTEEYLRSRGADPLLCGEGMTVVSEWGKILLSTFLGTGETH